jgi:NmrA-like family
MRIFEIAREEPTMRHFVWSNLDYVLKLGNYNEKYKTSHYDGKGRVAEWIQHQPCGDGINSFGWTIFTNGPYMEMLAKGYLFAPKLIDGIYTFGAPVGDGHVCMIALDDLAFYVDWIFSNPEKSSGIDLAVSTEDVKWDNLVKTFIEVTGQKATLVDLTPEQYFV